MKRSQLIELFNGLSKLKNLRGVKLAYAIAKNQQLMHSEIEALQECIKPADEFLEFEEKRLALCRKHCLKDEKGNPIEKNGLFLGLDENDEFQSEISKLKKQYHNAIDARTTQLREYTNLLNSKINFDFYTISLSDIPDDVTVEQMEILSYFIDDTNK